MLGGIGIVAGLATTGYRVMQTIGTKITELTPTCGFAAVLAALFFYLFGAIFG